MEGKLVVQFSEKDLLCKKGCGFYGNPQWQGFCSKCWRSYQPKLQWHPPNMSLPEESPVPSAKSWTSLGFDKFLEKKNHQSNRRSIVLKSLLRKSPSQDGVTNNVSTDGTANSNAASSVATKRAALKRQLSQESQTAKEEFLSFLRQLPKPVAHDVSKQASLAVEKIVPHTHAVPINELSEYVQDMYQTMSDRLRRIPAMKDCEYSIQQILEQVERYICMRCYNVLFCPSTDEEVEDLSLQDRIRSLHWVTCGFLETGLDFTNVIVKDRIDSAITEINDINSAETTGTTPSRRDPQRKLESVLQCSKMIFEALKESRGAPASADEFLPALIYVILRANPPQLKSNTNFVTRFALPVKLMSGEPGYYFTNLCCALQFVQNLNADSLRMPREEFEAYTSGQLIPPLNDSSCRCHQTIKNIETFVEQLKDLGIQNDQLCECIDKFDATEVEQWTALADKVTAFRESHPFDKRSVDAVWMEFSPDKEQLLPPPLQPTPAAGSSQPSSSYNLAEQTDQENPQLVDSSVGA